MKKRRFIILMSVTAAVIIFAAVSLIYLFLQTRISDQEREQALEEREALVTEEPVKETQAAAPAATQTPGPTETPEPEETPGPTETPEITETPEPTPEARITEEPEEEQPEENEPLPDETQEPEPQEEEQPEEEQDGQGMLGDLEYEPAGVAVDISRIDFDNLQQYFQAYEISDEVYSRIYGLSYKSWADIPISSLRYVKILYEGFDGQTYVGELMVNVNVAYDITEIFRQLYEAGYQLNKVVLVDEYGADDVTSIADNNTSAFNYRTIAGTSTMSNHAYGYAIDVNPLNNPYIYYVNGQGTYSEELREWEWEDRDAPDAAQRHMITHDDLCYQLFTAYGWSWGGDWSNPKDYQHFEKP